MHAEVSKEIRAHLEEKIEELVAAGVSRREAELAARRQLGNSTRVEENASDIWRWPTLESWIADFRFAARLLRKNPGFSAIAVLTLAVAIGANTSILAVMNATLRPVMPYPHVEQLLSVYNRNLKVAGDYAEFVSQPFWRDMRERNHTLQDVAAYTWSARMNLSGPGGPAVRIRTAHLSSNYFSVLGTGPTLGREFQEQDCLPGHDRVAIISNSLWRDRYGAQTDLGGIKLQLDRQQYSVIGVLPADFRAGMLADRMDLFLPLQTSGAEATRRDLRSVILLARTKPGTPLPAAREDLEAIAKSDAAAFPATDGGWDANVISLRDDLRPQGGVRFMIFLGLAGLILLVACLNVSLLLVARGEGRRHETLVRLSLGATRARLVQLRACESTLIALMSVMLALVLAGWGRNILLAYTPAEFLNGIHDAPLDMRVLAATSGIAILSLLLVSLLPALLGSRGDVGELLVRTGTRISGRLRWELWLVAGQIAIGLTLTAGAGLLLRSLHEIMKVDMGFDPENLAVAQVNLDQAAYPNDASRTAFFNRVLAGLQQRQGFDVSAGSSVPFAAFWVGNMVQLPEHNNGGPTTDWPYCFSSFVYPGFFATLRNPILIGRDFESNEPDPVVLVNQAFVREIFHGQNPIGRLVEFRPNANTAYNGASPGARRVIGVVKDTNEDVVSYNSKASCAAFFSYQQNPVKSMVLAVRSSNPQAALAAVREEVSHTDPGEPLVAVQSSSQQMKTALGPWEFQASFAALSAGLALFLAILGVYGTVSHSVRQRTREIGIRIALGGHPAHIIRAVSTQTLVTIGAGIAVGLIVSFWLARSLTALLFQTKPLDARSMIASVCILALAGVLAAWLPARRATRVNPVIALRQD